MTFGSDTSPMTFKVHCLKSHQKRVASFVSVVFFYCPLFVEKSTVLSVTVQSKIKLKAYQLNFATRNAESILISQYNFSSRNEI